LIDGGHAELPPSQNRVPIWLFYVIAVTLGLGIRFATTGATGPPDATAQEGTEEVGHLHAVARNPRGGGLYLATHTGVFRLDGGRPVRIADRYQDTMSFVAVGPDEFLASGHPDLRDAAPARLGLIRSDDAANSWDSVSLRGTADLHAIVVAHGALYVADATSGALLVSQDGGRTWETQGKVDLAVLTVDPRDAANLLGVDHDGRVVESRDGGETWRSTVAPATTFTSIVWDEETGVVAAGADGSVWARSLDGGWVGIGDLHGSSPVLALDGDGILAAADEGRILRSTDGGSTWQPEETS
jgi:hypothetical protein